jgi:iron complex transport system ATP-binding protein
MKVVGENMVIELRNLSIGYLKGKRRLYILKQLNASLHQGELVCLVGENGVGKSTLLRTISGVQSPLSGEIFIQQKSLKDYSAQELARAISLVLTDRIYAGNLTVKEIVTLGRHPYTNWLGILDGEDQKKVEWSMEITGIRNMGDQLISELSDGQFQKTLIARALAQDTDIIILDEPTAHLDVTNKIVVMKLLKDLAGKTGKSVLMATHELELGLQIADHLWMAFRNDIMLTGAPEDLVLNGAFHRMINNDSIIFDDSNGRFTIKYKTDKTCTLSGEKTAYSLTRNALQRKGWSVSPGKSDVMIKITQADTGYAWQVEHEQLKEQADSIGDLLKILGNI